MKTKPLYDLHYEHKEWLNKLTFYKDEIKIARKRIAEVASKNSDKEVLAFVDHFESQMKVQANNIDELSHKIKLHEEELVKNAKKNPVAVDHRDMPDHAAFRVNVENFEQNFNELRKELISFLAKWM